MHACGQACIETVFFPSHLPRRTRHRRGLEHQKTLPRGHTRGNNANSIISRFKAPTDGRAKRRPRCCIPPLPPPYATLAKSIKTKLEKHKTVGTESENKHRSQRSKTSRDIKHKRSGTKPKKEQKHATSTPLLPYLACRRLHPFGIHVGGRYLGAPGHCSPASAALSSAKAGLPMAQSRQNQDQRQSYAVCRVVSALSLDWLIEAVVAPNSYGWHWC